MPRLSVWFVRAALAYLAAGFTLGQLMLFHKGIPLHPAVFRLLPAHIEFLLVGWMVQFAIGVAYWILPRYTKPPKRGSVPVGWLAFGLLNAGVMLAGLGAVFAAPAWVLLAGRAAEAGGTALFAILAWPRVKPLGK